MSGVRGGPDSTQTWAQILALPADVRQVTSSVCHSGPAALSRLLPRGEEVSLRPTNTRAGAAETPFPLPPPSLPSEHEGGILNAQGCPPGPLLFFPRYSFPPCQGCDRRLVFRWTTPAPACPILRGGYGFSKIAIYLLICKGGGMIEGKINYNFSSLTK